MKKILIIASLILLTSTMLMAEGKVIGKTYFDYTYNPDGTPTNKFEIHRVYIGYQSNITDNISYKVTTDVGRFSTGKDDRMSAYLKVAQIKWENVLGSFVVGLQGMNIFSVQEHNWGYRFVEKSPMDLYKWASSADLGIGYYNKFADKFHISAIVSNGTGYKKSENDAYKKVSAQLYYGDSKIKKSGNFNVGAIFTTESFDYVSAIDTTTTTKNTIVFGAFGMYQIKNLRIGVEFNTLTKGGSTDITKNIISAYANYGISKKFDVFARFDSYDPNTNEDNDGSAYIIGGFTYKPGKGLYIAPNIRYHNPQTGDATTLYKLNFQFKI